MSHHDSRRHAAAGNDSATSMLRTATAAGEKPGLARVQFLLDALGRPQDAFPALHVAGTNGKGSTCAMMAAILRQAGLRVGMFTSPHLIRYNERIVVDGESIADDRLAALLERLEPLSVAARANPSVGQPTEFEVATALALAYFAEQKVDVAVVEVGLGGRLDSTNVVRPAVSVITPIGIDHADVLGSTLSAIAAEKAGILRARVPVIIGPQREDAGNIIRRRARQLGAPMIEAQVDFEGRLQKMSTSETIFSVRFHNDWLHNVHIPVVGAHQVDNAALAVAAVNVFMNGAHQKTIRHEDSVRRGLATVRWPGRFETVLRAPLTIVDGAHNEQSAQALAATLQAVASGRQIVFVIGTLAEKPVLKMLQSLLPLAAGVICTKPSQGRTPPLEPEKLAELAVALFPTGFVRVEADPSAALTQARQIAGEDGIVVVCGSLYLVGEVKAALTAGEWETTEE